MGAGEGQHRPGRHAGVLWTAGVGHGDETAGQVVETLERAGVLIALAWQETVAGGMGATRDNKPPRRIGRVTATRSPSEMWRAFQLSGAVAT